MSITSKPNSKASILEEHRCGGCAALLFKADPAAITGAIHIKCRRCRQFNSIRPLSLNNATAMRAADGGLPCGPTFPIPA